MVSEFDDKVFIGVGTNLGDKLAHIRTAIELLHKYQILVIKTASVYETAPWGFETENKFYNTVFMAVTALHPLELLTTLKNVEKKMGRFEKQTAGYESRVIDLDILLYKDEIFNTNQLQIPHRYLLERQFVTFPLRELCGTHIFNSLGSQIPANLKSNPEGEKPFVVYKPLLIN